MEKIKTEETKERVIPEYIERMGVEKTELKDRIEKLEKFIDSEKAEEISTKEYIDLILQHTSMKKYLFILERRFTRALEKEGIK